MAGLMLVIWVCHQHERAATHWHDGQITSRGRNAVKRNLLVSRTRRITISAFTRVLDAIVVRRENPGPKCGRLPR